jgi:hypothetical protein
MAELPKEYFWHARPFFFRERSMGWTSTARRHIGVSLMRGVIPKDTKLMPRREFHGKDQQATKWQQGGIDPTGI